MYVFAILKLGVKKTVKIKIASDKINRMIFCFNLFDIRSPLFTYIICIIFNKYEKIYIGDKNVNCFF